MSTDLGMSGVLARLRAEKAAKAAGQERQEPPKEEIKHEVNSLYSTSSLVSKPVVPAVAIQSNTVAEREVSTQINQDAPVPERQDTGTRVLGSAVLGSTSGAPSQAALLHNAVEELQAKLLANNHGFATLLREIHNKSSEDAELLTLLSPEEVSQIMVGLQRQTGFVLASPPAKKSAGKKLSSKVTIDDL